MLADRIGRKPVFIFGAIGSGLLMFAYLGAISAGGYPLIFLAAILMSGVVYSAMNGIQPSLYGEMFPTRVRLSGMAIGTQIGFAIGGFAPTAATAIAGDGPDGWIPVAGYVLVSSLIAAAAVATARETFRKPLAEIDGLTDASPAAAAPRALTGAGVSWSAGLRCGCNRRCCTALTSRGARRDGDDQVHLRAQVEAIAGIRARPVDRHPAASSIAVFMKTLNGSVTCAKPMPYGPRAAARCSRQPVLPTTPKTWLVQVCAARREQHVVHADRVGHDGEHRSVDVREQVVADGHAGLVVVHAREALREVLGQVGGAEGNEVRDLRHRRCRSRPGPARAQPSASTRTSAGSMCSINEPIQLDGRCPGGHAAPIMIGTTGTAAGTR